MFVETTGKFNPQKAVEAWKKAKPTLLMNTGVSDLLRTLPYDPPQAKLGAYPAALLKLEAAMKDQKMQKERNAVTCLDVVAKDIEQYLQHIHKGRAKAIENIKEFTRMPGISCCCGQTAANVFAHTKTVRGHMEPK